MKFFNTALLLAAMAGTLAQAKRGRTFEANAYVTPKSETANGDELYLKQNMMNLQQVDVEV